MGRFRRQIFGGYSVREVDAEVGRLEGTIRELRATNELCESRLREYEERVQVLEAQVQSLRDQLDREQAMLRDCKEALAEIDRLCET